MYVSVLLTYNSYHERIQLAKQYHPDLNPDLAPAISQTKMAEIIEAYSQLMDDDCLLGAKIGSDSRVALAAEIYTIEELKLDRFHDVYTIRILYHDDDNDDDEQQLMKQTEDKEDNDKLSALGSTLEDAGFKGGSHDEKQLSLETCIEIFAHPEDSVSDLKRTIQEKYETEWGLTNRRMDRDKIFLGWELLCVDRMSEQDFLKPSKATKKNQDHLVMSYHLFLNSYDIQHEDLIYAVVRKSDGS
jgi:DnaJ-class molecular chaperone with C-terminal Zn finger domain